MPLKADARRRCYNTRSWKAARARILARCYGRCECRGECGRLHIGDAQRCPELHGQQGLWQLGEVVLQIAHVDASRSGQIVDDDELRAYCARCHLRYDESAHQQAIAAGRMAKLEARGQLRLC